MSDWAPSITARVLRMDLRHWLLALAAAWLGGSALTLTPASYGDGGEYHLTAESFLRHASPEMRPRDVHSLAARTRRFGVPLNFAATQAAYFEDRWGGWHSVHFWGYALITTAPRALLRLLRLNDLRNAQLLNAGALLLALHQILFGGAFPRAPALGFALLALFSPAAWYMRWTHPEAFSFACVVLALVWTRAGYRYRPVLAAALAAAQQPALLALVVPLWLRALRPGAGRSAGRPWLATAAGVPAVLPALFNLVAFGTPSLIARETTDLRNLSAARAAELLLDLNLGLLPYAPVAVVLFALTLPLSLRDRTWRLRAWGTAAVLAAAAFVCTSTSTWNHGSAGPSRYGVWLAAFVFYGVSEAHAWLEERGSRGLRNAWRAALAGAVVVQSSVVLGRGGLDQAEDDLRPSYAARLALRYAPGWYSPSPEIFVSRTLGRWSPGDEPAIYRDQTGCRKAWLRPRDADHLRETCGALPTGEDAFFDLRGHERRNVWRYVHY